MVSDLGVIAAEPNWPIMLPFGILLLAIALGPLIARYHWERHYHQLCVVLAGVVCAITLYHSSDGARRPCGNRLRDLHGCRWLFFCGLRRNSSARQIAERSGQQYTLSFCRCRAGKPDRDNRRVDASHSSLDHNEQRSHRTDAHRVFHFLSQQHWRRALAGGPAIVFGISQRRAVLVDRATLLARMADDGRNCSAHIFRSRFHQFSRDQKNSP